MKRAFTLIELLVVVAVIAALAGLLFPVYGRTREKARQTHCISNLRQIGGAIGAYLADWNDVYPWAHDSVAAWRGARDAPSWDALLRPYSGTLDIWHCPSDVGETYPLAPRGFAKKTQPFWVFLGTSYYYPGLLGTGVALSGKPSTAVKTPTTAPLTAEPRPWHDPYNTALYDPKYDTVLYNVLYCDGHVARKSWMTWRTELYHGGRVPRDL